MTSNGWFVLRNALGGGKPEGVSPDIILGGPHPKTEYTTEYDTQFNRTGTFPGINYAYVRAKNSHDSLAIGSVMVFAVRLSDLPKQSLWVKLYTSDGRESTNISADKGNVGVSGVPLIWEPGDAPPPDAPWCLIGEIVGDGHPLIQVPADVTDKAGFDAWIAGQTRLSYIIVQQPSVKPVDAPVFCWQQTVKLKNRTPTTLNASLTCDKGPVGGFLAYSFDKHDSAGQPIGIGKTPYQINASYSQTRAVEAGFTSTVTVTYTPPGDIDNNAEFIFTVGTEDNDARDDDLGTTDVTVVARYTLRFGQGVKPV